MPLWEHSLSEIVSRLDCRQWTFLTAPTRELHFAILVVLYRARQLESHHELPFNVLLERLQTIGDQLVTTSPLEAAELRASLNRLEKWNNVAMRLEPRQVRTIADRGLKLLLVRLSESTHRILEHLESQLDEIQNASVASARFSLQEVDDVLQMVSDMQTDLGEHSDEAYCRAGRGFFRARHAVEEAGEELLRLDLWLSETAVQTPDRQRLLDLLGHLDTYFDRYLQQVDARRERCFEQLAALLTEDVAPFLSAIERSLQKEFADDPTRMDRRAPEIRPLLQVIQEFLRPNGILDSRRMTVHQRLADVVGHLRRHLAEIVRRSQLVTTLRSLSRRLLHARDDQLEDVDALFLQLWQPAHAVLDENAGVPSDRAILRRPYVHRPSGKRRFAGASIRTSANGQAKSSRLTLIKQLEILNEFVMQMILRGQKEALVGDAVLGDFRQVRLLLSAIRMARLEKSQVKRYYLRYQVARPTVEKDVVLTLSDGSGRLHLPQLIFMAE